MSHASGRSARAAVAALVLMTGAAASQTPPAPRAPASRLPAAQMAVDPGASLRPGARASAAGPAQGGQAVPAAPADSQLPSGRLGAPEMAGRPQARVTARSDDSLVKAIESGMRCTCGCNLDVFTCRTTDFTCTTSPAMHRLVLARLDSGMTAAQVVAAFQQQYGEVVLMQPPKRGFNLAAYFMPFVGLLAGLVIVGLVIRGWFRAQPKQPLEGAAPGEAPAPAASDGELQRLQQELEKFEA